VWSRLTIDDWQLLHLLTRGFSLSETAATLSLGDDVVRERIDQVLRKLEVATLPEALSAVEQLLAGEPWPSTGDALDEVTRRRLDRQQSPD
jgi:hypothetical protein